MARLTLSMLISFPLDSLVELLKSVQTTTYRQKTNKIILIILDQIRV
jgi:hypothetical protein